MIAASLWVLLAVISLVVVVLVAVAVMPVRLRCALRSEPERRTVVIARPLAGSTLPIRLYDSARADAARRSQSRKKIPRQSVLRGAARQTAAVFRQNPQLVLDFLRPVHFKRLAVDADVGLGDPADTGQLLGLFEAARYTCPLSQGISVHVRPDFEQMRLSGRLSAEISLIPIAFVPPGIRLAWRVFGPGS